MSKFTTYYLDAVAREFGIPEPMIASHLRRLGFQVVNAAKAKLDAQMYMHCFLRFASKAAIRHERSAHQPYLEQNDFDVAIMENLLEPEALEILHEKGNWFLALTTGLIHPVEKSEIDFIEVATKRKRPTNEFEFIWRTYLDEKERKALEADLIANRGPILSWEDCEVAFPIESKHDFRLLKKMGVCWLIFELPAGFHGLLHLCELDWNFAAAQEKFAKLKIGDSMQVLVKAVDSLGKRLILGRKELFSQTLERKGWTDLRQGTAIKGCRVLEVTNKRTIFALPSQLYGFINHRDIPKGDPLQKLRIGEVSDLFILEKDASLGLVRMGPKTLLQAENRRGEVGGKSRERNIALAILSDAKGFGSHDDRLKSLSDFKKSIYWQYLSEVDQEFLTNAFRSNGKLYSPVHQGKNELVFTFDIGQPESWDRFQSQAIPSIFGRISSPSENEAEAALLKLSSERYWYNSFKKKGDQFFRFRLFNERYAIFGSVDEELGRYNIVEIKIHNKAKALPDKQASFKFESISLELPLRFAPPIGKQGDIGQQLAYWGAFRQKLESFAILRRVRKETNSILETNGKDFLIFQDYLESQIQYEKEHYDPKESAITNVSLVTGNVTRAGETIVAGEAKSFRMQEKDMVAIYRMPSQESRASGSLEQIGKAKVGKRIGDLVQFHFREFDYKKVLDGFITRTALNTSQFAVQVDMIKSFFEGNTDVPFFDKLVHHPDQLLSPHKESISFFNSNLVKNPDSAQAKAVAMGVGNQNLVLIQGPPGTGKTTVITEIALQLINRKERVLIASQTHIAVDNVLEKLADNPTIQLIRFGNEDAVRETVISSIFDAQLGKLKYFASEATKIKLRFIDQLLDQKFSSLDEEISQACTDLQTVLEAQGINDHLTDYFEKNLNLCLHHMIGLGDNQLIGVRNVLADWLLKVSENPSLYTKLLLDSIDIAFGTCIGLALDRNLRKGELQFDTVILDEAGKANLSETLIVFSMAKKIILVGDHKQLPPYLDNERVNYFLENQEVKRAKEPTEVSRALSGSFFEYVVEMSRRETKPFPNENMIMLNVQHRMHPSISRFVSETFYGGKVEDGPNTSQNVMNVPAPLDREVILIDTSTHENPYESSRENSFVNEIEAKLIVYRILPKLFEHDVRPSELSIVTPYSGQRNLIQGYIYDRNLNLEEEIEVATLDSFQGRERKIIIFSFTRSSPGTKVGFLDDARRLNVAFSRAICKLILVGNVKSLTDPRSHFETYYTELFRNLKRHAENFGAFLKIHTLGEIDPIGDGESILEVGQEHVVRVIAIIDKGAKVRLGHRIGFIRNFDISWKKVGHPSEQLSVGQELTVKILKFNDDKGELFVGLKQLEKFPHQELEHWMKEGISLDCLATHISELGIFVVLPNGVPALLHFSKILTDSNQGDWRNKYSAGDHLKAYIIRVDAHLFRVAASETPMPIFLGGRNLKPTPQVKPVKVQEAEKNKLSMPLKSFREKFPVGSPISGKVVNIDQTGRIATIDLAKDVIGICKGVGKFKLIIGGMYFFKVTGFDLKENNVNLRPA